MQKHEPVSESRRRHGGAAITVTFGCDDPWGPGNPGTRYTIFQRRRSTSKPQLRTIQAPLDEVLASQMWK